MDEYLVVRGGEVRPEEAGHRISGNAAMLHLGGLRRDSSAERTLVDLYELLGGVVRSGLSGYERRAFIERAWADVEAAFETGRLALLRLPRPVFVPNEAEEAEQDAWEDEAEPTSWVGLQLEDEAGEPVVGQRVRIKLPDGTMSERVSDDRGRIRMDGIAAGNCQVEFPGIDGADWKAA